MNPVLVGAAICAIFLYLYIWRRMKYGVFDRMPGPKTLPILGNLHDMNVPREKRFRLLYKYQEAYGSLYRVWFGPFIPTVVVAKAEEAEVILKDTIHITKSMLYDFITPWLGTGLLTSTGSKWFSHRKMLTPSFHFHILENFVEVFNNNAKILVEKLKETANGDVVDVYPKVTLCALDIISESSIGVKINAQKKETSQYVKSCFTVVEYTIYRIVKVWLYPDFIFRLTHYGRTYYKARDFLHEYTRNVISQRKRTRKLQVEKQNNEEDYGRKQKKMFLDMLLDVSETQSVPLTDEEIREEVDTFMFEGHDTTTAAITWAIFLLGHHPEIQEKAYEEQKAIFGDEMDRPVTSKDMTEMKYLERIIKEALRMYPSVPFIARNLGQDTDLGGYMIPKGCQVIINIFSLQYDPDVFQNPNEFNPDRFLPEIIKDKHPYAYVPFSAGPRNCIGQKFAIMEEKTILSNIIRNFRFESVETEKEITKVYDLVLKSLTGMKMRLYPRNKI